MPEIKQLINIQLRLTCVGIRDSHAMLFTHPGAKSSKHYRFIPDGYVYNHI